MAKTYQENGGWRTEGNGISVWAESLKECIIKFLKLLGFKDEI